MSKISSKTRSAEALSPFGRPVDFLTASKITLQLYESRVPAGAPTAAADDVERQTTLNDILLHHPRETFLLRVTGDSMSGIGMNDGDLLTVDRKLRPRNGDIVVACIDGQTTVKTLKQDKDGVALIPHNKEYQPITITPDNEFIVLGVVTNIIHTLY